MQLKISNAEGDRLIGITDHGTLIESTALTGTKIFVVSAHKIYVIKIRVLTPNHPPDPQEFFWVGRSKPDKIRPPIELYEFSYTTLSNYINPPNQQSKWAPLCSEGDRDPTRLHALVYSGDRYNRHTKEITEVPIPSGWINIACAESALYKMHKIGYTSAASLRLGHTTTINQRRAMLNAWTANVCGTGREFTVSGEEITLRETHTGFNVNPYNLAPTSIEAIWDAHGARCLTTPRRFNDEPSISGKIFRECRHTRMPASCSDMGVTVGNYPEYNLGTDYILTGNLDLIH